MHSTGNDIIALALIDKERSNKSGFYSKILSDSEKKYYDQTVNNKMPFDLFLWLCWSIKESTYKYLKRNQPNLVFSPTRIIIQHIVVPVNSELATWQETKWEGLASDEIGYCGNCTAGGSTYYFKSKIYQELITTVVSEDEKFGQVFWGFECIEDEDTVRQSKAVRSLLLQKLQTMLPGTELTIEKAAAGYPVIVESKMALSLPVSFAHHGKFVAYSFLFSAREKIAR